MIVRLVVSPPLPPHVLDEVALAMGKRARVVASGNDADVNASAVSVSLDSEALHGVFDAAARVCGGPLTAGRAFRFEVLAEDPSALSEDALRTVAVGLHGTLEAPVYVARRATPAAAWAFVRPMPWGRKGLAVGQAAPSLPFGGSDCLGAAVEVGKPTVLLKARLEGVPEHGLIRACAAVGGAESGFAEVGAYAAVSAADGASVVVLEFGDVARTPISRVLAVLDIEARRYGGCLGQTALLSHVPLNALLATLASNTGLLATQTQVLETHLPGDRPG
jgi:hypothetical protein